ncbi:helix-turn-helix domain-containing protein [Eilatimonas milleporae]|uniref:Helix-turn-helix protein n=1 Tax=Eilatimonas milleporae TaxID=911205 RepID=A0A3M0C8L6_9PROT|nr:helix-turn-helix transcriptional regulator [Eilatimonas milleporae]RMB05037.1 helix-turn-helix protein [Eilatimonas milleporae]
MNTSLGKIISDIRADKGLRPKQIYLRAGITQSVYHKIENGCRLPHDDELIAIANALGTNADAIVNAWRKHLKKIVERETI